MSNELKHIGQATPEQIDAWKKQYTLGIFGVEKAGRIAYFKKPSFKEIDYYHSMATRSESISDGWRALADTLYIGGDKELVESPLYLPTVSKYIQEGMAGEEAKLVNL